ncbi:MAG: beta-propeller fold lactonase family protein, partial [Bacteroidota bacterium]
MFTKKNQLMAILLIASTMAFVSCKKNDLSSVQAPGHDDETALKTMINENGSNPDEMDLLNPVLSKVVGYVYSETNETGMNKINRFRQGENGLLLPLSSVESGGAGNGMGLGSEGAVILDANHEWLFAVNAGDNSVSSFSVGSDGTLTLAHTITSGGTTPSSVTTHGNYLYVVNSGSSNICGFELSAGGMMTKIEGSNQPLSANPAGAAQISFQPEGGVLYVTEKATNKIGIFKLDQNGAAMPGTFMNSVGETPYGFSFAQTENYMVVSNAAGGAAGMGSATSYTTDMSGNTNDVNGAVADKQAAPCWVAVAKYG